MNIGITELKRQLDSLGFKTYMIDSFVVFPYIIPLGKFKGSEIEIALDAPQFPLNPPSGPYIKPFLYECSGGGGTHPTGGIHKFDKPTAEFQYWSRPFTNWDKTDKTAKVYLAFIRTLFDI